MGVPVRHRRILVREFLEVVGDDDAGDGSAGRCDANGPIDQMPHLARHARRRDVVGGHVLEQGLQIDFLLIARADRGARLLTDDGDDGNMVHLRVVETVQEMDRARPGGRVAETNLASELGVRRRHERRHLLMANLDVLQLPLGFLERDIQAADTIAGIAVDALDAPFAHTSPNELADVLCHGTDSGGVRGLAVPRKIFG